MDRAFIRERILGMLSQGKKLSFRYLLDLFASDMKHMLEQGREYAFVCAWIERELGVEQGTINFPNFKRNISRYRPRILSGEFTQIEIEGVNKPIIVHETREAETKKEIILPFQKAEEPKKSKFKTSHPTTEETNPFDN